MRPGINPSKSPWGRRIGYGVGFVILTGTIGAACAGTVFVCMVNPGLGFLGLSVFLGSVIIGGCLLKVGSAVEDLADQFRDGKVN